MFKEICGIHVSFMTFVLGVVYSWFYNGMKSLLSIGIFRK